MPQEITIVGAGLGGALMATYLGRAGRRVRLYERRSDPRKSTVGEGRSINLAISTRGIHALREVGVWDAVSKIAVPMPGRMIHTPDGDLHFQPYGVSDDQAINSVSRAGLNRLLVEAAESTGLVEVLFDHRCIDADLEAGTVTLECPSTAEAGSEGLRVGGSKGEVRFSPSSPSTPHTLMPSYPSSTNHVQAGGEFIIGADGAFSAIRTRMQRQDRFDYEQSYLGHGYKELTIPAGSGNLFQMEKHALHIWPRRSFMMIALPNFDGSFTCTLFWPFEGPNSFAAIRTEHDLLRFFREQFPDAVPLMPTLAEDYFSNPTGSLVTIRSAPWHVDRRFVLLGDACHAVVPFYGQGANAAFEDCSVLNECLADAGADYERAFERFFARRKPNVDALADLALENFVEMRDHTGSRMFLVKKKMEKLLHKMLPSWYFPLYTMVTFSRTPYAEARSRAIRQNRTVATVAAAVAILLMIAMIYWLTADS